MSIPLPLTRMANGLNEMSRAKTFSKARAGARKRPNPRAVPKAGPFPTGRNLNAVACILLAAVTIALYAPVVGHPFIVLDDREYVTTNPYILAGLSWNTVKWAFTATVAANWHPLTWLSHALDCQLFALDPAGHHLDSVLIHALNALLLFLLLAWVTKRVGPSLLVASLFAVHPINVESVAWIAERKNVLSMLFFLLAIGAYAWYARKPGWRRYLPVAALFGTGLMAKPMVITLPFVLLLLDYWPLERIPLGRLRGGWRIWDGIVALSRMLPEKIPLLFLSAASAWITLRAQRGAVRTLGDFPFATRIDNAVVSYTLYLWKMLWPARLAFYPHSVVPFPEWQWILSAFFLIGVTAIVVAFREKRYLPVGWFWFLGTLFPVIGLVQVGDAEMADRYAYLPLIGIFIMVAWGLADLAEAKRVRAVWRITPALCALMALCFVSSRQMSYWDSDYDLWSHALTVAENPLTHNALGVLLMNAGSEMTPDDLKNTGTGWERTDGARRHFERALELSRAASPQNAVAYLPDTARTLNNLGNLDLLQNQLDQAGNHYGRALETYRRLAQQNPEAYLPYLAAALNNLGSVDQHQSRLDEARRHFEEALKINRQLEEQSPAKYLPNVAMTLNNVGLLDAGQSRMDEARRAYEEALNIDRQLSQQSPAVYLPDLAATLNEFGILDASQNRMDEARRHFEEALKINRQLAEQNPSVYLSYIAMTLNSLGRVDRIQNRIEKSRDDYREALDLLRVLARTDNRYAGDVARAEASLEGLEKPAAPPL